MSTASFIAGLLTGAALMYFATSAQQRINGRRLEMPAHVKSFCESDFSVNYTALGARAPGERPADHDVASITFSRNCVALVRKVPEEWSLVDSGVRSGHAPDAAPYRPGGVHDKSRKAWLAYRERSAWNVDGTPDA